MYSITNKHRTIISLVQTMEMLEIKIIRSESSECSANHIRKVRFGLGVFGLAPTRT